ncbi:MAG: hypothetical protein LQ339_006608 [Xanthoria mediterranea]|nr:MAG: hypothetical protein LQ339_006608 [Xanthoria mediterranea]
MVPLHPLLFFLSFLPLARSDVSFPLTAISHYSELSPCGVSHVSRVLDETLYQGCTSATPISAYGSCLCAQRLRSVQKYISINFEYDYECSSTGVQPYLTAFCAQWGVDIAAAEKSKPSSTTTVSGGGDAAETGKAIPGNTRSADQPAPTTTPTRSGPTSSGGGGGLSSDNITIIATIAGSVAGILALAVAWKTYKFMKRHRQDVHHTHWFRPSHHAPSAGHGPAHGEAHELQGSHVPGHDYSSPLQQQGFRYK